MMAVVLRRGNRGEECQGEQGHTHRVPRDTGGGDWSRVAVNHDTKLCWHPPRAGSGDKEGCFSSALGRNVASHQLRCGLSHQNCDRTDSHCFKSLSLWGLLAATQGTESHIVTPQHLHLSVQTAPNTDCALPPRSPPYLFTHTRVPAQREISKTLRLFLSCLLPFCFAVHPWGYAQI